MKLSITSWSFPLCTLNEVGAIARALGFEGVDVGLFYRASLERTRLLAEPEHYGDEVRQRLGLAVPNLYYLVGDSLADRNLALPASAGHGDANLRDAEQAFRFARAAGAQSVFVLPGIVNPGQSRREAIGCAARSLAPLLERAQRAGLTLTVEPHVHSCLESPAAVLELLTLVPGLKLTLDHAHFACLGWRQEEIDPLIAHAAHVHLRQARPGALQTKMDEGTLNFPALFGALREAGYEAWMSAEFVHQNYMQTLYDDVLSESIKLRDLYRGWARAAA